MTVTTFASGSSGNCTLVRLGGVSVLVDAGISCRRIQGNLSLDHLTLEDLSGIFITHEHSDHVSGLATLCRRHDVPVYAPRTVLNRVAYAVPEAVPRLREFPAGEPQSVDGVEVLAFHTPHDTDESVGWRFASRSGETFALATDMGAVTDEVFDGLAGADAVVIEANHDLEMLRYGPYPYPLKQRILSDRGHLSNDGCADLARRLAERGTRYIILGHLSRENNSPALALQTVAAALAGTGVQVYAAPPAERLTVEVTRAEALC